MRVSEKMLFNATFSRLRQGASAVLKAEEQASSGLRINRPSDDPVATSQVIHFKKVLGQMDQHLRNGDMARSFLSVTDSVLSDVQEQLQQAANLAVAMSNGPNTAEDRRNAALLVEQFFGQMVDLANTTHEGQSLFSGNKVRDLPFDFQKEWRGQYIGTTVPEGDITINATPLEFQEPGVLVEPPPNDTLNVVVDGVAVQIVLPEGSYDKETFAELLQDTLNTALSAHPQFNGVALPVTVRFVPEGMPDNPDPDAPAFDPDENPEINPDVGHFVITSDRVGMNSSIMIHPVELPSLERQIETLLQNSTDIPGDLAALARRFVRPPTDVLE